MSFYSFLRKLKKNKKHKIIKESQVAHQYLDGLRGIEIGGSSYSPWGLNTINIDYQDNIDTIYAENSKKKYNAEPLKVDIISNGDDLPFKDNTVDFVINSHVLEHFWDPIAALEEWYRVVKPNGYIFMIIPNKCRTFDYKRERTRLKELVERHKFPENNPHIDKHHNVWITEDVLELCDYLHYNVVFFDDFDDKNGCGFTIVIKK